MPHWARCLSCQALLGGLSCGLQSWHDKYAQHGQVRDISVGNLPGTHCIGVGLQLGLEHGLPGRSLGALHFFRVLHQDDLAGDADGRRQYRRRSGGLPGVVEAGPASLALNPRHSHSHRGAGGLLGALGGYEYGVNREIECCAKPRTGPFTFAALGSAMAANIAIYLVGAGGMALRRLRVGKQHSGG